VAAPMWLSADVHATNSSIGAKPGSAGQTALLDQKFERAVEAARCSRNLR
jgi:hypothetical protein